MKKRTSRTSSSRSRKSNSSQRNRSGRGQESGEGMENDLHELFLSELADVYNAEQQLTKALPKMAKAAESDELREAFESHLEQTREHASRLEQVVQNLDEKLERKTCQAMRGLIEEADSL